MGEAAQNKQGARAQQPVITQSPAHSPVNVVIDTIGGSTFQVLLTLYTGLYWIADAAETTTMTYLSSSVKCYWGVTSAQASLISSIAFIGQIVGFFLCGLCGDMFGRQKVLVLSAFWLVVFSIASAVAPTFELMVFFRCCVGMGMGSMPVTYTLLTECLPTKNRGIYLTVVHAFWGVGAMLCAGIAWAVMPDLGFRWLLGLTAVPAAAILCCCWFVPESPYWLHVKGRVEEAEAVLRRIARVNRYKGQLTFHLPPPDDAESAAAGVKSEVTTSKTNGSCKGVPGVTAALELLSPSGGEGSRVCTAAAGTASGPDAAAAAVGVAGRAPCVAAAASRSSLPASPFDRALPAASSMRRPPSAKQMAGASLAQRSTSLSPAPTQITVTWSQRGMHVRAESRRATQQLQQLSLWQRGRAELQRWWEHTRYDFRHTFELRSGRLWVTLVMIAIWFVTQTSSYGTTQTVTNIQTEGAGGMLVCHDGKPDIASSKYRDVFTGTAADIIATLLLVLFIEGRLGRKWLFMCTLSAWGTWLFVLTAGLGHDAQEAFIWLARGCNAASVVVMNVMTPEMYPTSIRGFAVGLIESISRLGGFISPYIVNAFHDQGNDIGCLILFGSLVFTSALLALLVRDRTGQPLEDYDEWDTQENIK